MQTKTRHLMQFMRGETRPPGVGPWNPNVPMRYHPPGEPFSTWFRILLLDPVEESRNEVLSYLGTQGEILTMDADAKRESVLKLMLDDGQLDLVLMHIGPSDLDLVLHLRQPLGAIILAYTEDIASLRAPAQCLAAEFLPADAWQFLPDILSSQYMLSDEIRVRNDHAWALMTPAVYEVYPNQVVAVHREKVWGFGEDAFVAIDQALAQPGCPHRSRLTLVPIPETVWLEPWYFIRPEESSRTPQRLAE